MFRASWKESVNKHDEFTFIRTKRTGVPGTFPVGCSSVSF